MPLLFRSKKEFLAVSLFLISIISFRLYFLYQDYKSLKNLDGYYYTTAQIVKVYPAKYGNFLFKLKSLDNLDFYLYSSFEPPPNRFDWVRVKIRPKEDTTFLDYLRGFFAKGIILYKVEPGFNVKRFFKVWIDKQHQDDSLKSFYHAIFLADPLDRELREKISNLGVSHLVAMSGFHLGILWMIIYGILYFPYRFLQTRFFPWRYRTIDLGIITLLILAFFVLLVGAPAAIIRAYIMLVISWIVLVFGFK
ncbi:MAG: hypothetical protein GXN91_03910, partial [Epsilonproteobacteria bacterium]|nr:hypothetical protein [Campylobacterota bacterium]